MIYYETLSIMSFDIVISFLGGYMNIVYVTLYSLTIVYRNFNLD